MADEEEATDSGSATAVENAPAAPASDADDLDSFDSEISPGGENTEGGEAKATEGNADEENSGDAEAQEKVEEKTDEQVPVFNPDLLERAQKAGLSETDITEFESEKSLRHAVKLLEGRAATQTQKVPGETKADETEAASDAEDEDLKLDFDPEVFDPKAVEVMNKLVGAINDLKKQNRGFRQSSAQREHEEWVDFFDGEVTGLGADYEEVFGKGHRDELDEKSAQYTNRTKLWTAMATIEAGLRQRNEKVPARKELFKQALRMSFGDKISEAERKKISATLTKRKSQFTTKPTHRNMRDARSSDQKAIDAVAQKMEEMGMDPGERTAEAFST